jgi:hypothetical protein
MLLEIRDLADVIGLLRPSSGSISINGRDVIADPACACPPGRLPDWLSSVHSVPPIQAADFLLMGAWATAALAGSWLAMMRRG